MIRYVEISMPARLLIHMIRLSAKKGDHSLHEAGNDPLVFPSRQPKPSRTRAPDAMTRCYAFFAGAFGAGALGAGASGAASFGAGAFSGGGAGASSTAGAGAPAPAPEQVGGAGAQHFGAGAQHFGAGLQQVGAGLQQVGAGLQHVGAGLAHTGAGLQHLGAGAQQVDFDLQQPSPHPKNRKQASAEFVLPISSTIPKTPNPNNRRLIVALLKVVKRETLCWCDLRRLPGRSQEQDTSVYRS